MGEQVAARFNGGVAQLGEHLPCKQGVMSSNLTISIAESNLESPSRQAPDELSARRFAKLNEVFSSLVERTNHHTYLENRILNQERIFYSNIKTSEAHRKM